MVNQRDKDLEQIRQEFDVPTITDFGLILDTRLPYYHWRDLKEQAEELDQVPAFVPRKAHVSVSILYPRERKPRSFFVPRLSEVREDRDSYIRELELENERLRRRLEEGEF